MSKATINDRIKEYERLIHGNTSILEKWKNNPNDGFGRVFYTSMVDGQIETYKNAIADLEAIKDFINSQHGG